MKQATVFYLLFNCHACYDKCADALEIQFISASPIENAWNNKLNAERSPVCDIERNENELCAVNIELLVFFCHCANANKNNFDKCKMWTNKKIEIKKKQFMCNEYKQE